MVNKSDALSVNLHKRQFMVEKLTVIFFIVLCLLLGVYLILSPWTALFGSWENNYLLYLASERTGFSSLQALVASTWFRGAVTGLGVLNLLIAFWEAAHFQQSVEVFKSKDLNAASRKTTSN